MASRYIILEIDGIERTFDLDGVDLTIGRGKDNVVALAENIVSGQHARIFRKGDEVLFEDLHSRNGTYIDDTFIHGGIVPLGSAGRLVFSKKSGPEVRYRITDQPPVQGHGEIVFQKAYEYLKKESYQLALAHFEHVIDEGHTNPAVYYYAGFAASKINMLDTAIVHFEQYLAVMPRDVRAMVDLGKLYERKGLYAKAAARYRKAHELKPGDKSILLRIKDLDRFEPVTDPFRLGNSTEDILGTDLIEIVETRHFRVTYNIARHGRRLNDVLKILEETYTVSGKHLGIYPQIKVPVFLASEEGSFNVGSLAAMGSASREGIRILVSLRSSAEELFLYVQLIHEYIHFLLDLINPYGREIPWWLHEGLAQYESQNMRINSMALISQMLHDSALIPMEILEKGVFDDDVAGLVQLAYAQAYSMVEYLITNYGWDSLRKLLHGLTSGEQMNACLGVYDDFETSWQEWLKKRLDTCQEGRTVRL
jgi:tetratricopeptide (TPR) repeat protein